MGRSSFAEVYPVRKPSEVWFSPLVVTKNVMTKIYISCSSRKEAEKIARFLLKKRLAACCTIIPRADSFYLWPSKSEKITKHQDTILLVTTKKEKYKIIEREVKHLHSYQVPCIFEIPVGRVSAPYLAWLRGEM